MLKGVIGLLITTLRAINMVSIFIKWLKVIAYQFRWGSLLYQGMLKLYSVEETKIFWSIKAGDGDDTYSKSVRQPLSCSLNKLCYCMLEALDLLIIIDNFLNRLMWEIYSHYEIIQKATYILKNFIWAFYYVAMVQSVFINKTILSYITRSLLTDCNNKLW